MDFLVVLMFSFRNCKFSHDIPAYLAAKTHDIRVLESSEISDNAPFVKIDRPVRGQHMDHPSIALPAPYSPKPVNVGSCVVQFA